MKAALLYGSTHGCTRKVVKIVLHRLMIAFDLYDVKELPTAARLEGYQVLGFFSPTYGDEELQLDMEVFIRGFTMDLTGKHFFICELGNYYGYDDFSFGAMRILRRFLLSHGGKELCPPLSLDSLPRVDWPQLERWIECVNRCLADHIRSEYTPSDT